VPLGLRGSRLRVRLACLDRAPVALELETRLLGQAGALASLAALATLVALDPGARLDVEELRAAVEGIEGGELGRLAARRSHEGCVVIDDAYNANPASMRSSIHAASEIARGDGARLVLVLGAMYELGTRSAELHAEVGRAAAEAAPAAIVVVGALARPLAEAALAAGAARVDHVPTAADAVELARSLVRPGDVVLVKASNSLGLSAVANALHGSAPHAH
jgi:UDP-N-acetylmuramoyl-tripeptide--D-alanyl-D-alanine ligase